MDKGKHTSVELISDQYKQSYINSCNRVEKHGYHIKFNRHEIYTPFSLVETDIEYFTTEVRLADWLDWAIKENVMEPRFE